MVAILLHPCSHRSHALRSVLVRLWGDVVTSRCVWSRLEEAQNRKLTKAAKARGPGLCLLLPAAARFQGLASS